MGKKAEEAGNYKYSGCDFTIYEQPKSWVSRLIRPFTGKIEYFSKVKTGIIAGKGVEPLGSKATVQMYTENMIDRAIQAQARIESGK